MKTRCSYIPNPSQTFEPSKSAVECLFVVRWLQKSVVFTRIRSTLNPGKSPKERQKKVHHILHLTYITLTRCLELLTTLYRRIRQCSRLVLSISLFWPLRYSSLSMIHDWSLANPFFGRYEVRFVKGKRASVNIPTIAAPLKPSKWWQADFWPYNRKNIQQMMENDEALSSLPCSTRGVTFVLLDVLVQIRLTELQEHVDYSRRPVQLGY